MAPKRTFIAGLMALSLLTTPLAMAEKVDPAANKTRTLHVTVGAERLRFEIPEGMCFADHTNRQQAALIDAIRRMLQKKNDEHLLGLFMPCDSMANPMHPAAREGRVPTMGLILWPHRIEDVAPRSANLDYLNWRAASFVEYVDVNLPLLMMAADPMRDSGDTAMAPEIEADVARSDHALMSAFTQYLSADGRPFHTVGAVGTTLVKGHPVEIIIRLNAATGITTTTQAHEFMADFMDLQADINR